MELVYKTSLNRAIKLFMHDPKRFSKIPWSRKNFEMARKEFLSDFLKVKEEEDVYFD